MQNICNGDTALIGKIRTEGFFTARDHWNALTERERGTFQEAQSLTTVMYWQTCVPELLEGEQAK